MKTAAAAGIDGFALNVANDGTTIDNAVPIAYQAAEQLGNFQVFLQFDYNHGPWDAPTISAHVNKYAGSPAQLKIHGKPLVSTFEGSADAWPAVKAATGCHFVPDWTSKKTAATGLFAMADGALSWDIWPAGAHDMSAAAGAADIDAVWTALLGPTKTYVMGVAPWFYTNLPQYGKNWIARGAGLWHARWQAAVARQPPVVEIVTWNDFGESHYVGPNDDAQCFPAGSEGYVKGMSHAGWLATLPAYVQAYKAGPGAAPAYNGTELLAFAHTPNPVAAAGGCSAGGTMTQDGSAAAPEVAVDAIDVYAVVRRPASVSVQVGGVNATFEATTPGVNFFSVPLRGQTGAITYALVRDGKVIAGGTEQPGISTDCSGYGGKINYNAITGVYKCADE